MSVESDLEIIAEQERQLVFTRFDEDVAFALGAHVREAGRALGKGIAVGVYLWDRTMFYGATAGASGGNRGWVERKANTVRLQMKSTYRIVLERGDKPRLFEDSWAVDAGTYVIAGGAFPIVMAGLGVVGAVATSGLSERDDHELSRRAIAVAIGRNPDDLALLPV
ncbi:heme-degrading domain-containing protein [uncultured Devosia sp.]|uniref:heme-degrading domain-containing protein n=1 Tax=uncultured Devosia sp. TaxID=211434 RepID=UPI0035CC59C9